MNYKYFSNKFMIYFCIFKIIIIKSIFRNDYYQ